MNKTLPELFEAYDRIEMLRCSLRQLPVSVQGIHAAQLIFQRRTGKSAPEDLVSFWNERTTVEYNGAAIWTPTATQGGYYTRGVVEEDEEWGADGFVLIGNKDDVQHLAYNSIADRWQYLDYYDFEDANTDHHVVDQSFPTFTDLLTFFLQEVLIRWQWTLDNVVSPEHAQNMEAEGLEFRETHDIFTGAPLPGVRTNHGGKNPL